MSLIPNPISHSHHAALSILSCTVPAHVQNCSVCGWKMWVERHTIESGERLRKEYFDEDRSGPAVKYRLKPGYAVKAALTYWRHGVCLKCEMRSIMVGRCAECGITYQEI